MIQEIEAISDEEAAVIEKISKEIKPETQEVKEVTEEKLMAKTREIYQAKSLVN